MGAYDIKANVDRMSIAPAKPFNFVRKEPKFMGHESDDVFVLRQEELKRKLRQDYSMMLFATLATRAILFQLIPMLTVLTIFTSVCSPTHMMVYCDELRKNLPELLVWDSYDKARLIEQQRIDEANEIRVKKLGLRRNDWTVNSWLVSLIGTTMFVTESRAVNFFLNIYKL